MEKEVRKILTNLIATCSLCLRAAGMRGIIYEDTWGYPGGCSFLHSGYDCPFVKRTIDDLNLLIKRETKMDRGAIGKLVVAHQKAVKYHQACLDTVKISEKEWTWHTYWKQIHSDSAEALKILLSMTP